jgi:hypothetical protein
VFGGHEEVLAYGEIVEQLERLKAAAQPGGAATVGRPTVKALSAQLYLAGVRTYVA